MSKKVVILINSIREIDPTANTKGTKEELQDMLDNLRARKDYLVNVINVARPSNINHSTNFLQKQNLQKLINIAIAIGISVDQQVEELELA